MARPIRPRRLEREAKHKGAVRTPVAGSFAASQPPPMRRDVSLPFSGASGAPTHRTAATATSCTDAMSRACGVLVASSPKTCPIRSPTSKQRPSFWLSCEMKRYSSTCTPAAGRPISISTSRESNPSPRSTPLMVLRTGSCSTPCVAVTAFCRRTAGKEGDQAPWRSGRGGPLANHHLASCGDRNKADHILSIRREGCRRAHRNTARSHQAQSSPRRFGGEERRVGVDRGFPGTLGAGAILRRWTVFPPVSTAFR